jgi:hypothetical protein
VDKRKETTITRADLMHLNLLIEELEALVDADVDCDIFMAQHVDLIASCKQIIKEKLSAINAK